MLHKPFHPLTISLVGSAISVLACWFALNASTEAEQSGRLALSDARVTRRLAVENRKLIEEVKSSRRSSILISCREGNDRHTSAKVFVGQLVAKGPHPRTKAAMRKQSELAALFLEAIAPKYNCAARLAKFTANERRAVKSRTPGSVSKPSARR